MKNHNSSKKSDKCSKGDKGIILIIVLWVLFFLSVVVLTLGFKNRINIRLRSLNNEEIRTFYLAKEGLNRIIIKLAADDAGFDSLGDDWSKELVLEKDYGVLSVKVTDEDRFLNINLISKEELYHAAELFEGLQKEDLEAIYKSRPFNVPSEIEDINMIDDDKFDIMTTTGKVKFYELLTTFSDGKLNINTVTAEVLLMIPGSSRRIVESIIDRRKNTPFKNRDTLSVELSSLGLTPQEIGSLIKLVKVNSSVFRIKSKAISSRRSIEKIIEVVIKREENGLKILYAREN
ncbi:MAG: general secretion pathway protein GspK [Candidatus Omnitrophica bacterium]|nr:general secretion pathway protein GspK [Candidatus Omnitrophota bacterium]